MIILKGQFDLSTKSPKEYIFAQNWFPFFKTKLPLVAYFDFDFGRKNWTTISMPVIKRGLQVGFQTFNIIAVPDGFM